MNRLLFYLLSVLMLVPSIAMARSYNKNGTDVQFMVLKNYFHNNDAPLPSSPLITTKAEFDSQFGMATFMGNDGEPTSVNFKRQVVLAIVLPETDKATIIDSVSVKKSGEKELTIIYTVHEGINNGYTIQPIYLMSIDRKYKNYTVKLVPTWRNDVKVSSSSYQFVSLSDNRHNLSVTVDYPIEAQKALTDSLRTYLGNRLMRLSDLVGSQADIAIASTYTNKADGKGFLEHYCRFITINMDAMDSGQLPSQSHSLLKANIIRVYEDDNVVSYETSGYVFLGGAHGMAFSDGATFDKATGRRLTLVKESPELLKMVTEKLRKNVDLSKGLHFTQEPVPMPKAAPYIAGNGKIRFVYQPYEIGAYAMGMPECEFYPYEIEDYLTDDGKALMP